MQRNIGKTWVAAVTLVVGIALAGAPALAMDAPAQEPQDNKPCSTPKTAVMGALAGALLAKLANKDVAKGAAIGGAIAGVACVSVNYKSRKTISEEQLRAANPEAQRSSTAVVTQYDVQLLPARLSAGQPLQANTNVELLAGTSEAVNEVSVKYTLVDASGKVQRQLTKPVTELDAGGGGVESSLSFTPPAGIPRGTYRIDTELFVNGTLRAEKSASYEII